MIPASLDPNTKKLRKHVLILAGWCWLTDLTILNNDGVRQWEGLYIPYMKWKIKHVPNHQPVFMFPSGMFGSWSLPPEPLANLYRQFRVGQKNMCPIFQTSLKLHFPKQKTRLDI